MRKLIAMLLVCILTISLLSGCSWNPFNKEKGPKTGPVGKWDIPIPKINPLGSQSLYGSTEYALGSHSLSFIENYQEASRTFSGETWRLMVLDDSKSPLEFLKKYAKKAGAEIYPSQYGDRVVFSLKDKKEPEIIWWGDAMLNSEGYELSVLREVHALVDKPLTFKPKEIPGETMKYSFATSSEGKKFQSITVSVPNGIINANAELYMETGVLAKSFHYERELNSIKTDKFILDDIPQGEGTLIWNFTWEKGNAPEEVTFLLQELYDIPPVKIGDELGALKVTGVPFGTVTVEKPMWGEVEHADGYTLNGDITKEGDTLFWLPSGYWNVVIEAEGINLDTTKSRLVPVNAGEMTVLKLPSSIKSTFSSLNAIYEEVETTAEGIELFETKDLKDTASIAFAVHDPKKRDIFPSDKNTKVIEGGVEVKILDIKRQGIPPSVVLLLDSSGSMKNEMAATIESAKKFIGGLPDNSFIQVVDFDSEVKVLKGTTKSEVIKSLGTVKASGSTLLYDSIIKGIELLKEKDRPTLVVFSDGKDSSHDPKDVGSSATKEDVVNAIKEAAVPLYTIGFGPGQDGSTLKEFAGVSEGVYYPAKDQKALQNVFTAINSKFGNLFTLTYERPKELPKADTPVVSLVMDNSGSMDTDPAEEEGCGYRIDKVKSLFHDFVVKLPEDCLTQMINFHTGPTGNTIINIQQVTSSKKPELLQALGEMPASNGTPILESITAAYENIKPVPTTKKVIVYMTDAALEVSEEEQVQFERLLKKLKDDEIQVIWVGMGVQGKEDVFKRAAELSGGRYVVSEDVGVLKSTLEETLALINEPKTAGKISLSINIDDKSTAGDIMSYSASTMVAFSKPAEKGKAEKVESVETATGTVLKRYDKETAELIYGMDVPSKDVLITKRMELNGKGSNNAMELSVKEAYYFGALKGVGKPDGKQFLALEVEMKNITKDKIPYQIPSFTSQFYVGINDFGMYPASNATWLANTPIAAPGQPEIQIEPGETIKGAMIFLVPEESVVQKSLHYYDTAYGHIGIPLVGPLSQKTMTVAKLPTEQPVNITDAFSMRIKGTSLEPKLDVVQAEANTTFRVIDAEFETKVQALLDIDPSQRLLLSHDTAQGPLLTKMSDVTASLPFGFMKPVMLAPGSSNMVRMAYQIPNILSNTKCDIVGDLRDGTITIPVVKGQVFGTNTAKSKVSGDGMDLVVNDLVTLGGVEGYGEHFVAADITVFDASDGFGTAGFEEAFALVRNGYSMEDEIAEVTQAQEAEKADKEAEETEKAEEADTSEAEETTEGDASEEGEETANEETAEDEEGTEESSEGGAASAGLGNFASGSSSENMIMPEGFVSRLLFGVDGEWAVFDGAARRGIIIFQLPSEGTSGEWTLQSPFFKSLKNPIRKGTYGSSGLLVYENDIAGLSDEFEEELLRAIELAVAEYEVKRAASGEGSYVKSAGLSNKEGAKNKIPVPTIVYSGVEKIKAVGDIKDFSSAMEKLKWLPSKDEPWKYRYSREAVLTQGWGNEWDLAVLAEGLLSKLGYSPVRRNVKLTAEGREKLLKLGGNPEVNINILPGLSYVDQEGKSRLFVVPFMKDITKLDGMVYMTAAQEKFELLKTTATVSVFIKGESLDKNAASQFGDAAAALGGEDGTGESYEYVELLSKEVALPDLSMDAVDIGYVKVGKDKGDIYKATLNTSGQVVVGDGYIDDGKYKILGVRIIVSLPGQEDLIHEKSFLENQTLKDIFQTVGINLPDLPEESAKLLQTAADKVYKGAKDPADISVMKWYSRSILNRFISNQSIYDEKTAKALDLKLGRTSKSRSIVVTACINPKNNKFMTSIDIMQGINEVQRGSKEAQNAYNIGSGIFLSQLEGRALRIDPKIDLFEIWGNAPEDRTFMFVTTDDKKQKVLEAMKNSKCPEILMQHLEEGDRMFIIPDRPTEIDGEKHWAWLEIDPVTYETISVLDTGEHGGMAGYVLNLMPSLDDTQRYAIGGFVGITTSVWAVCDFSLVMDDYKAILQNAAALVSGIEEHLEFVMNGTESAKSIYDIAESAGESASDPNKDIEISSEIWKLSLGPCNFKWKINTKMEIGGETGHNFDFMSGFKDGAALYFKNARGK